MRRLPTGDVSLGGYISCWALASQTLLAAILVQPGSPPTLYGEPESGLSLRKWLNEGCLDALLWNLGGSIAF